MANVFALRSVVTSLAITLRNAYDASPLRTSLPRPFGFDPISSGQLAMDESTSDGAVDSDRVTLFVHRVGVNPHLRTSGRVLNRDMDPLPLSLDVHLLFSIWTNSPEDELTVLAWLMRELHLHPILDSATLNNDAAWEGDEVVQLIPEELSTEDMMRLWDALTPSYRLSVSYIARVVRIDPDTLNRLLPPVVASRFDYQEAVR
ncbi:MAG TPA: DUF4255 domain-containing protein [Verrucomicrobiota bacterium]|nr:DUF4255 domain-containing protein [Verrucomicrobiota bacterium]